MHCQLFSTCNDDKFQKKYLKTNAMGLGVIKGLGEGDTDIRSRYELGFVPITLHHCLRLVVQNLTVVSL